MSHYNHILVATDFSDQSSKIIQRANELAQTNQATLSIIHVIDNLPIADAGYGPVIPFDGDLTQQLIDNARQKVVQLAEKLAIKPTHQWVEIGSPKFEIVNIAEQNKVDLIVVGSHGKHGLALLLGSTANGILHYAKCDVLAVRLFND